MKQISKTTEIAFSPSVIPVVMMICGGLVFVFKQKSCFFNSFLIPFIRDRNETDNINNKFHWNFLCRVSQIELVKNHNQYTDTSTQFSCHIAIVTTYPDNISNIRIPRAHQSTALPWPLLWMTSGARYSGVPQSVHVLGEEKKTKQNKISNKIWKDCYDAVQFSWYRRWNMEIKNFLAAGDISALHFPDCSSIYIFGYMLLWNY